MAIGCPLSLAAAFSDHINSYADNPEAVSSLLQNLYIQIQMIGRGHGVILDGIYWFWVPKTYIPLEYSVACLYDCKSYDWF